MERMTRFRSYVLLGIFGFVLFLYATKLFSLQIIETNGNTNNATTYSTITTVRAARGDILDRNGNVLVGNRAMTWCSTITLSSPQITAISICMTC